MLAIVLYILFCIVCFAVYVYHDWVMGVDISLKFFIAYLFIAMIPLVNLVVLLSALYFTITQHLLKDRLDMDVVVIKGKKPTKDS